MPLSYSTAVEGGAPTICAYVVAGRFDVANYLRFVAERAHWLGLRGWAAPRGEGTIEMLVGGPEALVGALEMACLLGPLDALVDSIEPAPIAGIVESRFEIRQK
jgi:acylphosphatase